MAWLAGTGCLLVMTWHGHDKLIKQNMQDDNDTLGETSKRSMHKNRYFLETWDGGIKVSDDRVISSDWAETQLHHYLQVMCAKRLPFFVSLSLFLSLSAYIYPW